MIAASIALASAIYWSMVVVIQSANGIANKTRTKLNGAAILTALSWGAFYYFTHA